MDFAVSPILVPVDFSRHSELAIRYAMALASRLEASVALLHVVEEPVAAGTWGSFESKISCRSLSISRSPRSSSDKRQEKASAARDDDPVDGRGDDGVPEIDLSLVE